MASKITKCQPWTLMFYSKEHLGRHSFIPILFLAHQKQCSVNEKLLSQSGHLENKQEPLFGYDVFLHTKKNYASLCISIHSPDSGAHRKLQDLQMNMHLCTLKVIERHHILI